MSNQPKNTEYALEMRQVSKRFPGTLAVDKVDFRVKRGEVHALMGENGAGKSTLMKMLNGLFNDYTGDIYINGEKLMESYGKEVMRDPGLAKDGIDLGADEYFVLGDNRNNSMDSRMEEVGLIAKNRIIGRAWLRIYPFSEIGFLKHGS